VLLEFSVQHFCKTKEVKIPFKEEPPVQLPNWVMVGLTDGSVAEIYPIVC